MKALENIISISFEPEHGHWASDNDHIKKAKVIVTPKEELHLAEFSFTLLTRFKGKTNSNTKNFDKVNIASFVSWKKNSTYEYDLDIVLPQDFFYFNGSIFDIECFIKFDIIPSEDCNKKLRKQFIKEFKVGGFIDSWTSYSKQFPMEIENNGAFRICKSTYSPFQQFIEFHFIVGGTAFTLCLLYMIFKSFTLFALVILLISGFFFIKGLHYMLTIHRLGNAKFEFDEGDLELFQMTITGKHLRRLKKIEYHLALIEKTENGSGDDRTTHTHEIYSSYPTPYQGPITNTIDFRIPYPKRNSLPASFHEPDASLNWSINLKLTFNNGLIYNQTVPITFIKKLQS